MPDPRKQLAEALENAFNNPDIPPLIDALEALMAHCIREAREKETGSYDRSPYPVP